jgi:Adenylosuccinate synthase
MYIFLEKLIEVDISIISTGPDRSDTIDRKGLLDNI